MCVCEAKNVSGVCNSHSLLIFGGQMQYQVYPQLCTHNRTQYTAIHYSKCVVMEFRDQCLYTCAYIHKAALYITVCNTSFSGQSILSAYIYVPESVSVLYTHTHTHTHKQHKNSIVKYYYTCTHTRFSTCVNKRIALNYGRCIYI